MWLVQLEIPKEEATKGQKEGRKEAGRRRLPCGQRGGDGCQGGAGDQARLEEGVPGQVPVQARVRL